MDLDQSRRGRRTALKQGTALIASVAAMMVARAPAAASKMAKADFHYQSTPKNGNKCIDCNAYISRPGGAEGECKVVDGPIDQDGWCMAFSPRPKRIS